MGNYVIPFIDYSNETSSVSLRIADDETDPNITVLFNAVTGVALGNAGLSQHIIYAAKDGGLGVAPSDTNAQRESKYAVFYVDTVNNRKGRFEIPTADRSLLTGNTDGMDTSGGAGLALKNAIEAHCLSRDGNPIVVGAVRLVGRNL